jgi:hypothetical protein
MIKPPAAELRRSLDLNGINVNENIYNPDKSKWSKLTLDLNSRQR